MTTLKSKKNSKGLIYEHHQSNETNNLQEHLTFISKSSTQNKDSNQHLDDDDWVCPVAVALRKAGYNVPLRPSKSWLERDRKKQTLRRQRRASSKSTP